MILRFVQSLLTETSTRPLNDSHEIDITAIPVLVSPNAPMTRERLNALLALTPSMPQSQSENSTDLQLV